MKRNIAFWMDSGHSNIQTAFLNHERSTYLSSGALPPDLSASLPYEGPDPSNAILALHSHSPSEVLSGFSMLLSAVAHNYSFPLASIPLCLEHAFSPHPAICEASQDFLRCFFSLHPAKLTSFAEDPSPFLRLLFSEFNSKTVLLFDVILSEKAFSDVLFATDTFFPPFITETCQLDLLTPNLLFRLQFLNSISHFNAALPGLVHVIERFVPAAADLPTDLFHEVLNLLVTVSLSPADTNPVLLELVESAALDAILSRYSPEDAEDARLILSMLYAFSCRGIELAEALLVRGVDEFIVSHYATIERRDLALVLLRNLMTMLPRAQGRLLESGLVPRLVEALPEEACRVKKQILLLLCSFTRSIGTYTKCFLENRVIAAYLDGLELGSRKVWFAVVNSLRNMLAQAITESDKDTITALLETYGSANIDEVIDDIASESENEELLKGIDALSRLIHFA
jgi:hypothetical protein